MFKGKEKREKRSYIYLIRKINQMLLILLLEET